MDGRFLVDAHSLVVIIGAASISPLLGGAAIIARTRARARTRTRTGTTRIISGEDAGCSSGGLCIWYDPPRVQVSPPSDGLSDVTLDLVRHGWDGNVRAVKGIGLLLLLLFHLLAAIVVSTVAGTLPTCARPALAYPGDGKEGFPPPQRLGGVVRSMFVPALIDTSTAWSLVPARPLGNVCCPLGLLVCLCSSRSKQQHNSYRRVIMKLKTPHLSPPKRRDFAPRDHVAFTSSHAPIRPSTIVVHSSTTLHYGSQ